MSKEHRDAFKVAVEDFRANGYSHERVRNLERHYGNARTRFRHLDDLYAIAMQAGGPILELGSGLSSVVLGLAAEKLGTTVTCWETQETWKERMEDVLALGGIETVTIALGELPDVVRTFKDNFGFALFDGPNYDETFMIRARALEQVGGWIKFATVMVDDRGLFAYERELPLWAEKYDLTLTHPDGVSYAIAKPKGK